MNKKAIPLCAAVVVCCIIMALTDSVLKPPYAVKSIIKILLFLLIPLIYGHFTGNSPIRHLRTDKKALLLGASLGVATFCLIMAGYQVIGKFLDLSFIPGALADNGGITADNFLYVSLYIALCNSLLEEFFFRGFAFLTLKKIASASFSWIFSAGAFAMYHAGMLDGWFSPWLYLLTLAALFGCGLFFNWLNARRDRIWVSWLVHLCANVAINTIGATLLGMR